MVCQDGQHLSQVRFLSVAQTFEVLKSMFYMIIIHIIHAHSYIRTRKKSSKARGKSNMHGPCNTSL